MQKHLGTVPQYWMAIAKLPAKDSVLQGQHDGNVLQGPQFLDYNGVT